MKIFLYILLAVAGLTVNAEVRVVFVEVQGYGGRQIQLEKDGRFAHVAISYKGQWLQALPQNGVELVSYADLAKTGKLVMLKSRFDNEPSDDFVTSVLGRPFEMRFSWDSDDYYCSKLVGKILALEPHPMDFSSPVWPPSFKSLQGEPGLSPDDVYEQLIVRGYLHVSGKRSALGCETLL